MIILSCLTTSNGIELILFYHIGHAFHAQTRAQMTIWEAMEKLNTLIDESDPDTSLSQIEHLLQAAEAMKRDGKPRWMQLTGLIHDLGKLLFFYGAEGQWDVVGDTFPVGCALYVTSSLDSPSSPFSSLRSCLFTSKQFGIIR